MLGSSCCCCHGCCNFSLPPATCTINYILIGPVCLLPARVCVRCVWGMCVVIYLQFLRSFCWLTAKWVRTAYSDGQHGWARSNCCSSITHALCLTLLLILCYPFCCSFSSCVCGCVRLFKYSLQIPIAFALKLAMPTTTRATATVRAAAAAARLCFPLFFFFASVVVVFWFWFSHCVGRWSDSIWSKFLAVCIVCLKAFNFAMSRYST